MSRPKSAPSGSQVTPGDDAPAHAKVRAHPVAEFPSLNLTPLELVRPSWFIIQKKWFQSESSVSSSLPFASQRVVMNEYWIHSMKLFKSE